MAAAPVDIVVLEKRCRRQHDVGHLRRLGHELLVHADEQILARKPALHLCLIGATDTGLVFWIIIAVTGGPPCNASRSPVRIAPMRD